MTQPSPGLPKAVRFGLFEVDFSQSELRKRGRKVLLQDQPFKLLALLLQRPGEIVAREELQQSLWPADTFVDFDESLNKAIQKLRQALGDSSDNPHLIETIPRRGYRFIAPVEPLTPDGSDAHVAERPEAEKEVALVPPMLHGLGRERALWLLTLAVAIGIISTFWGRWPSPAPSPLRKFTVAPKLNFWTPVISPDGRHIAFVAEGSSKQTTQPPEAAIARLWIQDLNREEPREIDGTEDAGGLPFWSPDSEFVGFAARDRLWKAPLKQGGRVPICELADQYLGGTWSADGRTIVFSINHQGIFEVPAGGGVPKILIPVDGSTQGGHFDTPYFLPTRKGERSLLYASWRAGAIHDIVLDSLESGKRSVLIPNALNPVYSPTRHILYGQSSGGVGPESIMALPFSLATMKATGDAFLVARNTLEPSVARDGTLVYPTVESRPKIQLAWRDRSGKKIASVETPDGLQAMSLSPDGRSLALAAFRSSGFAADTWILDLTRGTKTLLTFPFEACGVVIWSPTGKGITVCSNRQGDSSIYTIPADGVGEAKVLVGGPLTKIPVDWSPDGRLLVYVTCWDPKTGHDLWYLKPKPDGSGYESVPFLRTPAAEGGARFSPDGQFLAYVSTESNRAEVYVRHFPDGSGKRQISLNGGTLPYWRKDGKELFYLEGDTIVSVSVATRPAFAIGGLRRLFKSPDLGDIGLSNYFSLSAVYAVSPDGQRFLFPETLGPAPPPVIRVVENWFAEFGDRASRDR